MVHIRGKRRQGHTHGAGHVAHLARVADRHAPGKRGSEQQRCPHPYATHQLGLESVGGRNDVATKSLERRNVFDVRHVEYGVLNTGFGELLAMFYHLG